jgi:hypothetical protein
LTPHCVLPDKSHGSNTFARALTPTEMAIKLRYSNSRLIDVEIKRSREEAQWISTCPTVWHTVASLARLHQIIRFECGSVEKFAIQQGAVDKCEFRRTVQ